MYVRVATTQKHASSHRNAGVFQRAYDLYYSGDLHPSDAGRLEAILRWFERNLPLPDRSKLHPRAIFWFKPGAGKTARRIWELAAAREGARAGSGNREDEATRLHPLRGRSPGRRDPVPRYVQHEWQAQPLRGRWRRPSGAA